MTVTASKYALRENDHYETEAWAVDALVRACPSISNSRVYEPAAGNHAIVDALAKYNVESITSDIKTYEQQHDFEADYLTNDQCLDVACECDWIVTNPPYGRQNRLAVKFVERALRVRRVNVAMLLTAKFDFGKTRRHLFADNKRFAGKVALLDRISWAGNGKTGTEDHAWYIWSAIGDPYNGPTMRWEARGAA